MSSVFISVNSSEIQYRKKDYNQSRKNIHQDNHRTKLTDIIYRRHDLAHLISEYPESVNSWNFTF